MGTRSGFAEDDGGVAASGSDGKADRQFARDENKRGVVAQRVEMKGMTNDEESPNAQMTKEHLDDSNRHSDFVQPSQSSGLASIPSSLSSSLIATHAQL